MLWQKFLPDHFFFCKCCKSSFQIICLRNLHMVVSHKIIVRDNFVGTIFDLGTPGPPLPYLGQTPKTLHFCLLLYSASQCLYLYSRWLSQSTFSCLPIPLTTPVRKKTFHVSFRVFQIRPHCTPIFQSNSRARSMRGSHSEFKSLGGVLMLFGSKTNYH